MLSHFVGLEVESILERSQPDFIARCENSQVNKHKDTGWNKKYKHNTLYIFYFNPSRCIYIVLKTLQMYIDLHMLFLQKSRRSSAAWPHVSSFSKVADRGSRSWHPAGSLRTMVLPAAGTHRLVLVFGAVSLETEVSQLL